MRRVAISAPTSVGGSKPSITRAWPVASARAAAARGRTRRRRAQPVARRLNSGRVVGASGRTRRKGLGMDVTFPIAGPEHLSYIVALQARNKEALGFLPSMALDERVRQSRVFMGWLNGE